MTRKTDPTTRLRSTLVRDAFSDTINRVAYSGERIVLERRGKAVAAVVPLADLELLEDLEDRLDLDEARAAIAETRKKGAVSWEKVKAALRRPGDG